jgi:hypothetical protein
MPALLEDAGESLPALALELFVICMRSSSGSSSALASTIEESSACIAPIPYASG